MAYIHDCRIVLFGLIGERLEGSELMSKERDFGAYPALMKSRGALVGIVTRRRGSLSGFISR